MTTPPEAIDQAPLETPMVRTAPLAATRPLFWSVRRELWENRSLVLAPLVAAGVVLFGFLVSAMHSPHVQFSITGIDPAHRAVAVALPYDFAAIAVMLTAVIVGAFYCLGALHNERRDRSILFWKSLPVSDLTTVLAKASIPLIVLPVIALVVIVAVQLVMLAVGGAILLAGGADPAATWARLPAPQMWLTALYGLAVLALWYAPIWAWLLLVSGWARRAPFLWAVLPPLAICLVEKIALNTGYFANMLGHRLGGLSQAFSARTQDETTMAPLPHIDAMGFFGAPGLWIGLAVAAAFLAAAVWLRRRREPI